METDNTLESMTKKEGLRLSREKEKLDKILSGVRDMNKLPGALFVVDIRKEHIAVKEAERLGVPIFAMVDTNCDPDEVDFPIPGNDDAIRSAALLTRVVADAAADGLMARSGRATTPSASDQRPEPGVASDEPLAEWEQELLAGASAGAP